MQGCAQISMNKLLLHCLQLWIFGIFTHIISEMFISFTRKKKTLRVPEVNNFCNYPFMQILVTSDFVTSVTFKFKEAIQDLEEGKVASRIKRKFFAQQLPG